MTNTKKLFRTMCVLFAAALAFPAAVTIYTRADSDVLDSEALSQSIAESAEPTVSQPENTAPEDASEAQEEDNPAIEAELAESGAIVSFADFQDSQEVPFGTLPADLIFPETLTGIDSAGGEHIAAVTWQCESYDAETPGDYIFIAELPAEAALADGTTVPSVKITVHPQVTDIVYFCGVSPENGSYMLLRILAGEPGGAYPELPEYLGVMLSDGSYQNVPVSWSSDDYDGGREGIYTFSMAIDGGYTYSGALPYAQVVVGPDPLGL